MQQNSSVVNCGQLLLTWTFFICHAKKLISQPHSGLFGFQREVNESTSHDDTLSISEKPKAFNRLIATRHGCWMGVVKLKFRDEHTVFLKKYAGSSSYFFILQLLIISLKCMLCPQWGQRPLREAVAFILTNTGDPYWSNSLDFLKENRSIQQQQGGRQASEQAPKTARKCSGTTNQQTDQIRLFYYYFISPWSKEKQGAAALSEPLLVCACMTQNCFC